MVQDDPTKRPSIDEVATRFSVIRKKLGTIKLVNFDHAWVVKQSYLDWFVTSHISLQVPNTFCKGSISPCRIPVFSVLSARKEWVGIWLVLCGLVNSVASDARPPEAPAYVY
jgi:hypothetical protein